MAHIQYNGFASRDYIPLSAHPARCFAFHYFVLSCILQPSFRLGSVFGYGPKNHPPYSFLMTEKKGRAIRLAPHARDGIANPLNMAATSGARCNRIAIDTYKRVRESRKSHAAHLPHPRRPAEDHLSLFAKKETLSGSTICSRNSPAPSASSHSTNPQSLAASASSSISDSSSLRTWRRS